MLRTIYLIDDTINFIIRTVFVLLALLGIYFLYDSWYVYNHAQDTSFLRFKPSSAEDVETLEQISENVVAWITVEDTNIDYPIMQGESNEEYLNKDPYGKFALSGSIFLDSRNQPDFSDHYSMVYGHHMEHGMMFGALDKFLERDYFRAHQTGTLITTSGITYTIHFFSSTIASTHVKEIFAVTENDGPLSYIKEHASLYEEPGASGWEKQIICLSTCKTPDSIDRTLLFGYLEEEDSTKTRSEFPPDSKPNTDKENE